MFTNLTKIKSVFFGVLVFISINSHANSPHFNKCASALNDLGCAREDYPSILFNANDTNCINLKNNSNGYESDVVVLYSIEEKLFTRVKNSSNNGCKGSESIAMLDKLKHVQSHTNSTINVRTEKEKFLLDSDLQVFKKDSSNRGNDYLYAKPVGKFPHYTIGGDVIPYY